MGVQAVADRLRGRSSAAPSPGALRLSETPIPGAYLIDPVPFLDDRGEFTRVFCAEQLAAHGLETSFSQVSVSCNARRGTLRGMHFQAAPHEEVKLVRCSRGSIYDVIVDLRRDSHTYRRWFAVVLTEASRRTIYVPAGLAHGFQTLEDGAEVTYMMSAPHAPALARGVRFDDPAFGIEWPAAERVTSRKDRGYPDYAR